MKDLETRYHEAIEKIGRRNLLELPKQVREVLKSTTDLKIKVEMLEKIANANN